MSGHYKIAWLCEALLVSRSGYYDWVERRRQPGPRHLENIHLRERIRDEFARSRKTYGSPRLARALGCPGRRNRIARLMRLERIFARQRSKYRPRTTDSRHGGPIAPNRLRNLIVRRPDQVWVTDATGILTSQGWLYLVAVLDVCTRRVLGWAMHQILDPAWSSPPCAWRSSNGVPEELSSSTLIAACSLPARLTGRSSPSMVSSRP
jgi:putative transposase